MSSRPISLIVKVIFPGQVTYSFIFYLHNITMQANKELNNVFVYVVYKEGHLYNCVTESRCMYVMIYICMVKLYVK